jgi:transposase-like protein
MEIQEVAAALVDEAKAIALVERMRWPGGPVCPNCGGMERIYDLSKTRLGLRKCGHCRKQFTVRVGTIFEDSHIPLSKWLYAIRLMCASKKGVSANQLSRELDIQYRSAWFMCHRIRYAMTKPPLVGKLGDGGEGQIVEADETYIGGKAANNKHKGRKPTKKMMVLTLVERDGDARTFKIPNNKGGLVRTLVRMNVAETAHLMTDSANIYPGLDKQFGAHDSVNHSKEYVRGIIHTNFAESYHSLLKRGIFGTYHHISEKHLHRYLREFEFRWNSRRGTDGARAVEAIKGTEGKRLMYKGPVKRRAASLSKP